MAGTQITVTLSPELEAFIEERVAAGRFATAGEAVREGLRLLEEREQEREACWLNCATRSSSESSKRRPAS